MSVGHLTFRMAGALRYLAMSALCCMPALSAKADDLRVSLTPRTWYASQSTSFLIPGSDVVSGGVQETHEALQYPFVGGTVTTTGGWLGKNSIYVTALRGKSKADFTAASVSIGFPDISGIVEGTDGAERTDVEALFGIPLSDTTKAVFGGRYVGFDGDRTINQFGTSAGVFTQPFKFSKSEEQSYFVEFGLGAQAFISTDHAHQFFANLTALAGRTFRADSILTSGEILKSNEWDAGVDANFGYQFQMNGNTFLAARYRLFVSAPIDDWSGRGNLLIHGPEVSLTYEFK
jgi:hypothetical protein